MDSSSLSTGPGPGPVSVVSSVRSSDTDPPSRFSSRFLLVSPSDPAHTFDLVSPISINRDLLSIMGQFESVKKLRTGALLVESLSLLHAKRLLFVTQVAGVPASVAAHPTLNHSRRLLS